MSLPYIEKCRASINDFDGSIYNTQHYKHTSRDKSFYLDIKISIERRENATFPAFNKNCSVNNRYLNSILRG